MNDLTLPETRIGSATIVDGDLAFSGRLVIDGCVVGLVTATPEASDSMLVLSAGASIDGDIRVLNATVLGHIGGTAYVTGHAKLGSSARIMGALRCRGVEMQLGAFVAGDLEILDAVTSERCCQDVVESSQRPESCIGF
mgnify:FL=1